MHSTAARPSRATPIGHGAAHQALDDARERSKLQRMSQAIGCLPGAVSIDGIHISMPHVFTELRRQGYSVGEPRHAPAQVQYGHTIWHVRVALPNNGPSFLLGYFTPNAS